MTILSRCAKNQVVDETVICTYRVAPGNEDAFMGLLASHWPTLHQLGFVTDELPELFRSLGDGAPTFVEIFTWREGGFHEAHTHPRVLAIWERMEPLCEDRDGRPGMEFPHFTRLRISG